MVWFKYQASKSNSLIMMIISLSSSNKETKWERLMQQKLMIHRAEVMPSLKSKYKRKEWNNAVNFFLSILLVVRGHKIVKVIIKRGKPKELKSTSPSWVSKSALEHLIRRKDKVTRANMSHSDKVSLRWFLETHSWPVKRLKLLCSHVFVQEWVQQIILWIHSDMPKDWRKNIQELIGTIATTNKTRNKF
jgi:hypothetical protein